MKKPAKENPAVAIDETQATAEKSDWNSFTIGTKSTL